MGQNIFFHEYPLDNCNHRELRNEKLIIFIVTDAVIVQPGNASVISLEPEFIIPTGMGMKNRIARYRLPNAGLKNMVTITPKECYHPGDDFVQSSAFCQHWKQAFSFHSVCKPDSPQSVSNGEYLAANQVLVRKWPALGWKVAEFQPIVCNNLPLIGEQDALEVGWCEVTVTRQDTGSNL